MNILSYSGYDEILKNLYNGEHDPCVSTEKKYTFGDIINIWSKPGYDNSRPDVEPICRMFIRDDHYLMNKVVVIRADLKSYDTRTIMRHTYLKGGALSFRESFTPTVEDLLDHYWYEYIPECYEDYKYM